MPIDPDARASLRLAVSALVLAGFAGAWELAAQQSPGTPLYIGVLPGPIGALRELATTLGLLLLAATALVPYAARTRGSVRALVVLLHVGTACALGAQIYGALHGMYCIQAIDLRPDALPLFVIKYGGLLLFALAALGLARRVCFARSGGRDRAAEPVATQESRQLDSPARRH